MFLTLIKKLFSGAGAQSSQPDYEAFIKRRQQQQDVQQSALAQVSRPQARKTAPTDNRQKINDLFYNFLFGESDQGDEQDPLTLFVLDKVQAQMNNPASVLDNLPVLPESVSKLLPLLDDDHFQLSAILSIIEREPSMAGAVIQQANSARYRQASGEVTQLKQAFMIMGADGVRETVLNQFIKQLSPADSLYYKFFGKRIWGYTHTVASYCQQLAHHQVAPPQNGSAYFIGLFHALGHMVIFQFMVEAFKFVSPDAKPGSQAFKQLMQTYGAQLTLQIADHWQLPASIIHAINQSSNPLLGDLSLCLNEAIKVTQLKCLFESGLIDEDSYFDYCRYLKLSDDALDLAESQIES